MRNLIVFLAFAALLMCGGCVWPSEQSCYDVACKTIKADKDFPKDAKVYPLEKCKVYVLKNAAMVKVFYDHSVSGRTETDAYDVWLKRIARTWELDNYSMSKKYTQ
jgi:hypothetical protein